MTTLSWKCSFPVKSGYWILIIMYYCNEYIGLFTKLHNVLCIYIEIYFYFILVKQPEDVCIEKKCYIWIWIKLNFANLSHFLLSVYSVQLWVICVPSLLFTSMDWVVPLLLGVILIFSLDCCDINLPLWYVVFCIGTSQSLFIYICNNI